jgi:hypothetical protein
VSPHSRPALTVLLLTMLLTMGCSPSDRQALSLTTGIVSYKGKPVADADVTFTPTGGVGKPAYGRSGADGTYELSTYGNKDGAAIGEHSVTVVKQVPKGGKIDPSNPYQEYDSVLPKKYGDPKNSPLKFEVVSGGSQYDIELQD